MCNRRNWTHHIRHRKLELVQKQQKRQKLRNTAYKSWPGESDQKKSEPKVAKQLKVEKWGAWKWKK